LQLLLFFVSNKLYQEFFIISISFRPRRIAFSHILDKQDNRGAGKSTI